jgi:hypothetical protein
VGGAECEVNARDLLRRPNVDAADGGVRVLAAGEREIQHAVRLEVVDEAPVALEQRPVLDPRLAAPDLPRQVSGGSPAFLIL